MKKVIILRGVPGCGKSTYAKELSESVVLPDGSMRPATENEKQRHDLGIRQETAARVLDVRVFSADDYFKSSSGAYTFDATKLPKAHQQCFSHFMASVDYQPYDNEGFLYPPNDYNAFPVLLIVDNTNMKLWECSPYVMAAESFGWEVEIVDFRASIEPLSFLSLADRNKHNVPAVSIKRMYDNYEASLPWWKVTKKEIVL